MTNEPKGLPTLLPCPFCGGEADLVEHHGILGVTGKWVAFCTSQACDSQAIRPTQAAAIHDWNRRIPPAAVTRLPCRLHENTHCLSCYPPAAVTEASEEEIEAAWAADVHKHSNRTNPWANFADGYRAAFRRYAKVKP